MDGCGAAHRPTPSSPATCATTRCSSIATARCSTSRRRPTRCDVPDGLVELLVRVSKGLGGALAVLTGRRLAEIDVLLDAGELDRRRRARRRDPHRDRRRHCARRHGAARHARRGGGPSLRRQLPGIIAEPKGPGLAVHYRLAPHLKDALEARAAWAADAVFRWLGAVPRPQAVRDHSGRSLEGHGARDILRTARVRRPATDHDRRRHGRHSRLCSGAPTGRSGPASCRRALRARGSRAAEPQARHRVARRASPNVSTAADR